MPSFTVDNGSNFASNVVLLHNEPDEPSTAEPEMLNKSLEEQTNAADQFIKPPPLERRRQIVCVNGKYECESCQKTFSSNSVLDRHIQSRPRHPYIPPSHMSCIMHFANEIMLVLYVGGHTKQL